MRAGGIKTRYFAYGSNLDELQMHRRCPSSRAISVGWLDNHRLDFAGVSQSRKAGVATVTPSQGERTWGVVYEVTQADLFKLDRYEGHPWWYTRERMQIRGGYAGADFATQAWVYVLEGQPLNAPTSDYYNILKDGYELWGLDGRKLRSAHERAKRATRTEKRWSWMPRSLRLGWLS